MSKKIFIFSSTMFTNRMIFHSDFIKELLENDSEVSLFLTTNDITQTNNVKINKFPKVSNNPEWFNVLRNINNYAWALRLNSQGHLLPLKYSHLFKKQKFPLLRYLTKIFGFIIYITHSNILIEKYLNKKILKFSRSIDFVNLVNANKPDVIVITNPFMLYEGSILVEAKKLGLKIITLIPSWDNISTKIRMSVTSDVYLVWSEIQKNQLLKYYPESSNSIIKIIGTPQYDVFGKKEYHMKKSEFLKLYSFNEELPIVLYALGSPNFIVTEYKGLEIFVDEFIKNNWKEKFQLLIRPHPNKDNNELFHLYSNIDGISIQQTDAANKDTYNRNLNEKDLKIWVNTFKYSDIFINLSSTVILDALKFNKPVININYDPDPKGLFNEFIKKLNSNFEHIKTVNSSKAIYLVNSFEELKLTLFECLNGAKPQQFEIELLLNSVCGYNDYNNGIRMANAILNVNNKQYSS